MRPFHILSSALLCSSVASAWSLDDSALADIFGDIAIAHKRDPQVQTLGDSNAASPNPTQVITTSQAQKTTAKGGSATNSDSTQDGGSQTDGSSPTNSDSNSSSGSKTSTKTSVTVIDPRLPPGGISMITPNTASSTQYYKIGDYVTFAWNYTSLSVTPTAIDILATCTGNQQTYTLALNQSISATTGAFTWDTRPLLPGSTSIPLLTNKYTLIIYDAAKSISATPSSGYLSTQEQFTFAMYSPQAAVDMADFKCVTCNGALSAIERQSLAAVGIMATFAIVGATWFTSGFVALL